MTTATDADCATARRSRTHFALLGLALRSASVRAVLLHGRSSLCNGAQCVLHRCQVLRRRDAVLVETEPLFDLCSGKGRDLSTEPAANLGSPATQLSVEFHVLRFMEQRLEASAKDITGCLQQDCGRGPWSSKSAVQGRQARQRCARPWHCGAPAPSCARRRRLSRRP